jgi:hypothetical protein
MVAERVNNLRQRAELFANGIVDFNATINMVEAEGVENVVRLLDGVNSRPLLELTKTNISINQVDPVLPHPKIRTIFSSSSRVSAHVIFVPRSIRSKVRMDRHIHPRGASRHGTPFALPG